MLGWLKAFKLQQLLFTFNYNFIYDINIHQYREHIHYKLSFSSVFKGFSARKLNENFINFAHVKLRFILFANNN